MLEQRVRDLGDRKDEDQIEEEYAKIVETLKKECADAVARKGDF